MAAGDRKNPKRAKSSDSRYSLMEFMQDFPDDEACLWWLWQTSYAADDEGKSAHCMKCGEVRTFARYDKTMKQQRQCWTCTACGTHVHPTAGTIFHKSSTSLHLWFYAIYLISSTRCGISAKQLERELGVTYKTAWRMFNLIRKELMAQDSDQLGGDVEADETYIGGHPRLKDVPRKADGSIKMGKGPKSKKKVTVFGAVERGGRVRAEIVPPGDSGGIPRRVHEFILPEAVLFTDEYVGYNKPGKGFKAHHRIRHPAKIYVAGDVHTQTIDGFWALVKRGLSGTHHAVSAKHLQGYLNEYVWRYNHRDDDSAMFLSLILSAAKAV